MTNKLNKYLWFFLFFYLIYTPEIFLAFGINISSRYIYLFIFLIIFLYQLLSVLMKSERSENQLSIKKKWLLFSSAIVVSSVYVAIIAFFNDYPTRLAQNLFILLQVYVLVRCFNIYTRSREINNPYCAIEVLIKLAAFQGLISLCMFIIPSLKNFALKLYYLGKDENPFISSLRIFGISGEYTFFTPIYHSFLIAVIVYLYLYYKKNFLIFLPFIFIVVALNGRTGLMILAIVLPIIFLLYLFSHLKNIWKSLIFLFLIGIFSFAVLQMLKLYMPETYVWLTNGFNDVINFFRYGEKEGNIGILSNYVLFPEGMDLIFGTGIRLYGNSLGLPHSDIGYINDIYMGGIVYISILYIGILIFLIFSTRKLGKLNSFPYVVICISFLLIANFKGEAMRSGLLLIGIIISQEMITSPSLCENNNLSRINKGNS